MGWELVGLSREGRCIAGCTGANSTAPQLEPRLRELTIDACNHNRKRVLAYILLLDCAGGRDGLHGMRIGVPVGGRTFWGGMVRALARVLILSKQLQS